MSADFWAGYLSGAAGIVIGNPLDLVKVRLQAGGPGLASLVAEEERIVAGNALQRTFRRTATLATGAAAPIVGYGALNALLFVSYRQTELALTGKTSHDGNDAGSPAATWMAGAVAGLATWIVSAPTELVKCRAQLAEAGQGSQGTGGPTSEARIQEGRPASEARPRATPTSEARIQEARIQEARIQNPKPHSSWAIARQVYQTEGVRGFFLGGTVTALRDSIGYGFYFWSYRLMTAAWRDHYQQKELSQTGTLLCGGLAGIITWASVFPLDVIKTRVQGQAVLATAMQTGEQSSLLGRPPPPPPRLSTLAITKAAYREGGLGVFFRGLGVCSARAFVVNAVQWAVYEWAMKELGGK